jgi:hypothetical protein
MSAGLWIATRDGIIRNPESGEQFRIVKGRTLGHPKHPAVAAFPENWHPLDIELDAEDVDPDAPAEATQLAGELHDARNEADGYREQLAAIVELLRERELIGFSGIDADHEGWLVETLRAVLEAAYVAGPEADAPAELDPTPVLDDEPVAPPAPARKTRAARKVTDDAAS